MKLRGIIKGKKGDLAENVFSTVIAVLGLALLLFAAWKLYDYVVSQDARNAQKTINLIEDKINALGDGQADKFAIRGIPGWFLTGWTVDDVNRPDKCMLNNCLCICKGTISIYARMATPGLKAEKATISSTQLSEDCKNNGFCRAFSSNKLIIAFQNAYTRQTYGGFTGGTVNEVDIFPFLQFTAKNLYEIKVSKDIGIDRKITLNLTQTT